jgi:hypothetical protein
MLNPLNFDPDVRNRHYEYDIDGDVEEVGEELVACFRLYEIEDCGRCEDDDEEEF